MRRVRLLIEGKYDERFVTKLLNRVSPELAIKFEPEMKGGFDSLIHSLEADVQRADPVLAVLCDADEDCASQWRKVRRACSEGDLDLGDAPLPESGFLLNEEGKRKFGCWIMPNNQESGAIEAMLLAGIVTDDQLQLKEQARQFVQSVEPRLFPRTTAADQKATLRAWFAVQKDPVWVPSHAVASGMLLPDINQETAFIKWLAALAAMLD